MGKKIHLGLALHAMPSFSETFINNKIRGIRDNEDVRLTLFISKGPVYNNIYYDNINIHEQIDVNKRVLLLYKFFKIIIIRPLLILKFIKLELESGRSIIRIIKNIIINYNFFLCEKLDWIHFGFSNIGINRENIGKVLNAKLSCSFRGQDISIFPRLSRCGD